MFKLHVLKGGRCERVKHHARAHDEEDSRDTNALVLALDDVLVHGQVVARPRLVILKVGRKIVVELARAPAVRGRHGRARRQGVRPPQATRWHVHADGLRQRATTYRQLSYAGDALPLIGSSYARACCRGGQKEKRKTKMKHELPRQGQQRPQGPRHARRTPVRSMRSLALSSFCFSACRSFSARSRSCAMRWISACACDSLARMAA